MNRHPKTMQAKAKMCTVIPTEGRGTFKVESPSGSSYYVHIFDKNEMVCECKWNEYHPNMVCAHKLAVMMWLEAAGNHASSFWATEQDAKRQKKHRETVQDIWMTTRADYAPA